MGSGVYPHWGLLTPPQDVFDETDSRDGRSPILEIYFGEPSILFRLVLHQLAIFPIKATIRRPPPGTGLGTFTMWVLLIWLLFWRCNLDAVDA